MDSLEAELFSAKLFQEKVWAQHMLETLDIGIMRWKKKTWTGKKPIIKYYNLNIKFNLYYKVIKECKWPVTKYIWYVEWYVEILEE